MPVAPLAVACMEPSIIPGPDVLVTVPFTTTVIPAHGSGGAIVPFLLHDRKRVQKIRIE